MSRSHHRETENAPLEHSRDALKDDFEEPSLVSHASPPTVGQHTHALSDTEWLTRIVLLND